MEIPPNPPPSPELEYQNIEIEDTYETNSEKTVSFELENKDREEYDPDIENQIIVPRTDIENAEIVIRDFKIFMFKLKFRIINCCQYFHFLFREYLKRF